MDILAAVNFCARTKEIWQVVGRILGIFKIVIPLLIIIFGCIDLGKAVVASKDDEIKKAMKQLAMRAVAGIAIWFVPLLVGLVFDLVNATTDTDYTVCSDCITEGGNC